MEFLYDLLGPMADDLFFVIAAGVFAFFRAMGVQIDSGTTGLKFSFGRVVDVLEPGFHWLIPFAQKVKKLPTRSRTIDIPAQRVVTNSGLVYHVNVNLVYRVVDIRKALIEVDDVELGMMRILGVGIERVLRTQSHANLKNIHQLNDELARDFAGRLEIWGVEIERAAFTSITPSTKTLRVTQLSPITSERVVMLQHLRSADLRQAFALGLLGGRFQAISRTKRLRQIETTRRQSLKIRRALMQHGWMNVQISQAVRKLRSRADATGKVRVEKKAAPKSRREPAA
ncbi:MAG: regulator of protease activity HflC (stomatin/prohibitin superfamily) [Planctomycetota bacterium]|jgi:regulator of protease activity HflC (stomatin/prohibitin superfamily)